MLFKDGKGFAIGENPKAPAPYATWQFTQENGRRDYYWGRYYNDPQSAETNFLERSKNHKTMYQVEEVKPAPQKEYKYYSTQRPIGPGTCPSEPFNKPVHIEFYENREPVQGEDFRAWGEIIYSQPLTEEEIRQYELKPSRQNADIRERMEQQTQAVGKWEEVKHIPESKRFTWYYNDFGCYVLKEFITPGQLSERAHIVERQKAAHQKKVQKKKDGPDR